MRDLFFEALSGIMAHKSRSFLSTLGILFGVAAVIGILSIGEGAKREAEALIQRLGVTNFQIKAVKVEGDEELLDEVARKSQGLNLRDLNALKQGLPEISRVGGLIKIEATEFFPRPEDPTKIRIVGADPAYLSSVGVLLVQGRFLDERDEDFKESVCIIGATAKTQLFGSTNALGKEIRVIDNWFTVVGEFTEAGRQGNTKVEGLDLDDRSRDIIIPLSSAMTRFERKDGLSELDEILVAAKSVEKVSGQSLVAANIIKRLHREQPDWEIVVPLKLLNQSKEQQRLFNLVMGLIAGISLLVGGIGIMNIMLATVLERTKEIGVRMAIGASPNDILVLFLTESALISLIGGIFGIGAGYAISFIVAAFTGWSTAVSLSAVFLATLISMLEGVIFGLLPAKRAASLPPAISVRR